MKVKRMTGRAMVLLIGFGLAANSMATVFFEADFEGPGGAGEIPYVGGKNKHPGGGYISFLGGEVNNGINPGDGTQDYSKYTNVILDNRSPALGSISGSKFALKTQYRAGHEASFQKNTTIIKFPETDTVYVRWYQKWASNWVWPGVQQKLLKVKGTEQSQNFGTFFGNNYINITKRSPAPYEHLNQTYVFSNFREAETDFRQDDSIASNENYSFKRNRWYCIEVVVKSNTLGKKDAEHRFWVDDDLKFNLTNTDNRGTSSRGIDTIEMQHVVEGANNGEDTPTWMDNIVVSNKRIGCSGLLVAPPNPPLGLD